MISLVGVLLGLAITSLPEALKIYILVFVAGNFVFISADIWKNLFKNSGLVKNAMEFVGICLGVGVMYGVLWMESDVEGEEHNH